MAINLRAVLRLDGTQFTTAARRIEQQAQRTERATRQWRDQNGRLRDSLGRFTTASQRATRGFTGFNLSIKNVLSSVFSLKSAFLGVVGAMGGLYTAKKIFDNTIGEAMKYEQSGLVIQAMFGDKKKATQYMREMQQLAINSPLLNSQDIFGSSKSFIQFTQNIPQLKKMFQLAERLIATSPEQGVEGAVFAMKELFTGNAKSIRDRFEFGTLKEWKKIKDYDGNLPKQINLLDELMTKYRLTDSMIKGMGSSTLGIWNQIKESLQVTFRDMGGPAVQKLRDFLGLTNDQLQSGKLDKFKKVGTDIITKITEGFISGAKVIGKWMDALQNNPEFQKQTTFVGKVDFIFNDIHQKFMEWLENGGQDKINSAMKKLISVMSEAVVASEDIITKTFATLGIAIGRALADSFAEYMQKSAISQFFSGGILKLPGLEKYESVLNTVKSIFKPRKSAKLTSNVNTEYDGSRRGGNMAVSHAGGLSYVPYDGYLAKLHKGERVLTPEENAGRGTEGSRVFQFGDIHLHGVGGNMEEAAEQLMRIMARKIDQEGARMA